MHIYCLRNKIDGKVYIGKSLRRFGAREKEHIRLALKGKTHCPYLYNAIRVHGADAFETCLVSDHAESNEDLCVQERHYIAEYKANNAHFGYNLTSGGEGADYWRGRKRSPETIAKMRIAKLGTKQNPEVVFKRTRVHVGKKYTLGRKQSPEERKMRSLTSPCHRLGKQMTEESRGKLRQYKGEKASAFGKVWVHVDDKQLLINPEKLGFYKTLGWVLGVSDLAKRKNRDSHLGVFPSVETLQKRSAALQGKKRTEETKKRMSEAAKKRGVSREHIMRMVEARRKKAAA